MRFKLSSKSFLAGMVVAVLVAGCAGSPKSGGLTKDGQTEREPASKKRAGASGDAAQNAQFSQALKDIKAGELEAAEEKLSTLVKQAPKLAAAHNNLGVVYRQRGEFEQAEKAYKAALAAEPDNAKAHLNLGILYDVYLQRPGDALTHYQRFQALSKESDKEVALWIADLERRI